MDKQNKTILIAAGGTGGHIMPAVSLAESLRTLDPAFHIEFVHGVSSLEKDIYSSLSFPTHILSVGRLRKNISQKERVQTLISLPFVLLKALKILIAVKPTLVIGTGGAVSGPILLAGILLRKKTVLFEPNAVPGLSNRWIAPFVDEIFLVFEEAKKYFMSKGKTKYKKVSFPVRQSFVRQVRSEALSSPPRQGGLRVLILGGSQGSSLINTIVSELISSLAEKELKSLFSFVHQTGQKEFEHYKKLYAQFNQSHPISSSSSHDQHQYIQVFPFLHEIHKFYQWSNVVVGRAGAGFLAELSMAQRAGILIPLKNSADQHQLKNAKRLEKSAIVIEEKDLNKESLQEILIQLEQNPAQVKDLAHRLHKLKLGAPAEELTDYLIKTYFGALCSP